jgi:hypothetical protein
MALANKPEPRLLSQRVIDSVRAIAVGLGITVIVGVVAYARLHDYEATAAACAAPLMATIIGAIFGAARGERSTWVELAVVIFGVSVLFFGIQRR